MLDFLKSETPWDNGYLAHRHMIDNILSNICDYVNSCEGFRGDIVKENSYHRRHIFINNEPMVCVSFEKEYKDIEISFPNSKQADRLESWIANYPQWLRFKTNIINLNRDINKYIMMDKEKLRERWALENDTFCKERK